MAKALFGEVEAEQAAKAYQHLMSSEVGHREVARLRFLVCELIAREGVSLMEMGYRYLSCSEGLGIAERLVGLRTFTSEDRQADGEELGVVELNLLNSEFPRLSELRPAAPRVSSYIILCECLRMAANDEVFDRLLERLGYVMA